jgi:hypothetical protein
MTSVSALLAGHVTSKGPSMSRTAFFAGAPASASAGNRSLPASSSSSLLRKVLDAAQFLLPGAPSGVEAKSAANQPYPWLPAHIRRNMSARSQRLIRADY